MEFIKLILEKDINVIKNNIDKYDINEIDVTSGFTALHFAAQFNDYDLVKLLLEKGAKVDVKDKFGNTPLFKAIYFSEGKVEIINLLLKYGANPDSENNAKVTPRQLANRIASFDVKDCFK